MTGRTREEWEAAPDDDVQVVVLMELGPGMGWMYAREDGRNVPVRDRQLWTGEDEYNPFGWGVKSGAWMETPSYYDLWRRACSD